jgi:ATP-binding cassette subfamily C (CFTR/MRP) protein 10
LDPYPDPDEMNADPHPCRKGERERGGLAAPDDLFDLPDQLTVHAASDTFQHHWEAMEKTAPPPPISTALLASDTSGSTGPRIRLLRLLYVCFGREFLAIGLLKFGQDCAGFAGPILLNLVVTFMEDPTVPAARGYVYAVLLVSYLAFLPDLDPTLEPD